MPQSSKVMHTCVIFLKTISLRKKNENQKKKASLELARLFSVLLVCCVEGECVPGLQTLPVHPPFVPRLASVLPLLPLRVWKGQQGQHGEGKEGRLCPARPPGCPEGKGAWRAVEQRKRVSGKKRHFPSSFSL